MFKDEKMHEVEDMIKRKNHDLSVSTFATISGIRGNQFGKEIFATVIKFKDLADFLEVFRDVQRDVNRRKVTSIKNYILSGVDNLESMRFFPAVTVTARGHIFYDELNKQVAIDTSKSKLSVNDGQHRHFGTIEAIKELKGRLSRSTDREEINKMNGLLHSLEEMMLPMTIFNNLSEKEERQLFHDTNNLAQRPSRSATIRLAQTDLFSVMARELSEENRYLKHFGVETDKSSIMGNNPNTILLTTVHEVARRLIWDETKKGHSSALTGKYEAYKGLVDSTLNRLFFILPPDLDVKGKYILDKNYALKAIAKFIHDCRKLKLEEDIIFDTIANVNWNLDKGYWSNYGGYETKNGFLTFGSSGDHARIAVLDALEDNLPNKALEELQQSLDEVSAAK